LAQAVRGQCLFHVGKNDDRIERAVTHALFNASLEDRDKSCTHRVIKTYLANPKWRYIKSAAEKFCMDQATLEHALRVATGQLQFDLLSLRRIATYTWINEPIATASRTTFIVRRKGAGVGHEMGVVAAGRMGDFHRVLADRGGAAQFECTPLTMPAGVFFSVDSENAHLQGDGTPDIRRIIALIDSNTHHHWFDLAWVDRIGLADSIKAISQAFRDHEERMRGHVGTPGDLVPNVKQSAEQAAARQRVIDKQFREAFNRDMGGAAALET
jgi:hypothetical protein